MQWQVHQDTRQFEEVSSCFTASVAGRTAAERRCSARGWHHIRPLWKRNDQKGRDTQHLCNDEDAIGGGALSTRSHLLQSSSSRLRHPRMHQPVPNCSELKFGIAAGRHKLSDTDRWLDARPSPSGVTGSREAAGHCTSTAGALQRS